jgi:carbonic anhydrase
MKYMVLILFGLIANTISLQTSEKLNSLAKQSGYELSGTSGDELSMLSFDENLKATTQNKGEFHKMINFLENKKNPKKKRRLRRRRSFKDPIKIIKNGWLKISSPNFLHTGKFPLLNLPNDSHIQIKTTKNYFRINEAFNPMKKGNFPPGKLYFWFRLSGKHFYYSQKKDDINVLGSIYMKNIKNAKIPVEINCFRIIDKANRNWKLCADTEAKRNKWVCLIKSVLGYPEDATCKTSSLSDSKPVIITKKITQPVILIPQASPICNNGWDYAKKGSDWNCDCSEGKEQSPINLPSANLAISSPIKPIFKFNEVEISKEETTEDGQHKGTQNLNLEFRDHALRIKHKILGKAVTLDGALYEADEIIFHSPSEHQIKGRNFNMEMQVIFHGITKGDIAKHVVLSFLFERAPGVYNKFIDDLDFFSLPNPIQKTRKILSNLFIPRIFYSAGDESGDVLKPFSFYTYHGSLTQPPCTERTIHYVASETIKLGSTALELFQEAIRMPDKLMSSGDIIISNIPPENNRLPQPLNGRAIFHYDHRKFCGGDINPANKKVKPKGHYEKVDKKMIDYYYVPGEKPSGMPGSFVVSEKEAVGNQDVI